MPRGMVLLQIVEQVKVQMNQTMLHTVMLAANKNQEGDHESSHLSDQGFNYLATELAELLKAPGMVKG